MQTPMVGSVKKQKVAYVMPESHQYRVAEVMDRAGTKSAERGQSIH